MRQVVNRQGNPVADGDDSVVMQGLVKLAPSVLDFGRNHIKRRPAASEVSVKPTIELFIVLHTSPGRPSIVAMIAAAMAAIVTTNSGLMSSSGTPTAKEALDGKARSHEA
ncbi:hypothetical protein H257_17767 [Aphanomyces astaci]|uniref:Uncharacterized protein n=1 Tax=Aphanomyces astaci TaxID=112090 RepID=W4FFH0_APHAT|nr:hypothetical protein H257_17767 [Aphanomyces astaci]ETV65571.1 hypothetical protein H257_17767 [Aphanomyces astaci]|eukprot:XP_009844960.1 hypothetical protein H257_17767 [Aphanomyces astaci]